MKSYERKASTPFFMKPSNASVFLLIVIVFSGAVLFWQVFGDAMSAPLTACSGILFTVSIVLLFRTFADPDSVRAHQTDEMLKLSRQTLACLKGGLDAKSAKRVCTLLLDSTQATSVVITNCTSILGIAGPLEAAHAEGMPIFAKSIDRALEDGREHISHTPEEIGFYHRSPRNIMAGIVIPLMVGRKVEGTLVFFFSNDYKISATQLSIAEGFGQLVSTQLAAEALEEQQKLATSMELKALQSQINPHFLFNTINTIASLVRTDPAKARVLLRDFAVFYRRTLDDSADLIPLCNEVDQTVRYFSFEVARFGEDRVAIELDISPESADLMVPPFLIQPLVENSVQHAMPSEGKLTVKVGARDDGEQTIIWVADDGVGMSQEACNNILHPESSTGIGIAVKNVHDRMCGYFGPGTHMEVVSVLGEGTTVRLFLNHEALEEFQE